MEAYNLESSDRLFKMASDYSANEYNCSKDEYGLPMNLIIM